MFLYIKSLCIYVMIIKCNRRKRNIMDESKYNGALVLWSSG